jgi:SAM-dependent methyltransferase
LSEQDRLKWEARYRAGEHTRAQPSWLLRAWQDRLPVAGRALDVAGGAGRNAIWLAQHGLDVTIADISRAGLALASERAREAGVALRTLEVDLDEGLPAGPWELVVVALYLNRALFPAIARELAPGGWLFVVHPTVRNLEKHDKPPRAFLLDEGELALLLAPSLEVLHLEESWGPDDCHEARLVARRR